MPEESNVDGGDGDDTIDGAGLVNVIRPVRWATATTVIARVRRRRSDRLR